MIGWTRCKPNCSCRDEDDCSHCPKNVNMKANEGRTGCCRPYDEGAYQWQCACHVQMGADFWFLPTGSCLYSKPR